MPRSLSFFAFNFCQNRKSIFTGPRRCKWQDYFDTFDTDHWIGFVSRWPKLVRAVLGKQCLKTRLFCASVSCMGVRRNFSGGNMDILLIVLLANGRSIKDLPIFYRKKFPHKGTCSIRILFKIVFRRKRIRGCQKGALSVNRYSFCWIDI